MLSHAHMTRKERCTHNIICLLPLPFPVYTLDLIPLLLSQYPAGPRSSLILLEMNSFRLNSLNIHSN